MDKINNFHDFPGQILEGMERWRTSWALIEKWGIFGLCFGGKVAALMSRNETPYVVSGQAHPSFIANEDPELITIPHICLARQKTKIQKISQNIRCYWTNGAMLTHIPTVYMVGWVRKPT
ncbi:hypothetical protein TWF569_008938 [Orbilia oligospora]|uniref:Dienelactone hydrolase domain-containing protein n=1 Tax=Orbilia oligospora TaxID=2813651 RepID=A0A7C8N706_ORBOL|nr:hypothetical protein TWF102_010582 [Orbilia oligospora]KAF3097912.1 hypothetical protein TWF706_006859 [Orbilia oligospora]KAF3105812.1 hypothetical protein TWF103_006511 [Orbilia oligospora]KAF3143091.1 hypothetical protein TWF594_005160 [Orbilia oligospora]KAF3155571.1 hypothetical protein TWF569_008938 [Orbilia oligospora]